MRTLSLALSLFLLFISTPNLDAKGSDVKEKRLKAAIRLVGHKMLLESDDSSSRVLPIKVYQDKYTMEFESEIEIDPGKVSMMFDTALSKEFLVYNYLLEIFNCDSNIIEYTHQKIILDSNSMIACKGRILDRACYEVIITVLPYLIPFSKSYNSLEENQSSSSKAYLIIFTILLLLFIIATILALRNKKEKLNTNSHLISLGSYDFDKRNMKLSYENIEIELTSKESELLMLLYSSANVTVKRELILEKVWGDEGDYIGRTLDVFISKLRKKLQADKNIKIANIRGVGYRLILN